MPKFTFDAATTLVASLGFVPIAFATGSVAEMRCRLNSWADQRLAAKEA